MDLKTGIRIEQPDVVVPWGVTPDELLRSLPRARRLEGEGFADDVVWFGGLRQTVRFFFRPDVASGTLSKVEAGTSAFGSGVDFDGPFRDVQAHLVSALGSPSRTESGPFANRYPIYSWDLDGALVRHEIIDGHLTAHLLSIEPV